MRYPLEPLMALTRHPEGRRLSLNEVAALAGLHFSTVQKYQSTGLNARQAERLAEALKLLPYEVWPELLDASINEASKPCLECDEPFVPFRANQRFCSRQCQNRHSKRRRYRESAAERARKKAESKRYYDECAEYIRAQKRRAYRANREAALERNRAYRQRIADATDSRVDDTELRAG